MHRKLLEAKTKVKSADNVKCEIEIWEIPPLSPADPTSVTFGSGNKFSKRRKPLLLGFIRNFIVASTFSIVIFNCTGKFSIQTFIKITFLIAITVSLTIKSTTLFKF